MTADDFWAGSAITAVNRDGFGSRIAACDPGPPTPHRWSRPGNLISLRQVPSVLDPVLSARTSTRTFAPTPITENDLTAVLGFLAERPDGHRSYPAAGALYAIGLVAWLFGIDHPLHGHTAQYHPAEHALADLGKAPAWADEAIAFTGDPTSDPPPVFLGLFADLDPLHAKYGDRGDRFALLEAGEILQQLSLAVAARGLAGYAVGGSIDDRLIALAGLQPVRARFVVGYAFGNPT